MFLSEAIWRFRARCRSFSDCFRTRRHVRHTLSARDGAMALSVLVVAHPVSLTVFPLAPACSVVGSVAVTRASPLAPSWSAHTLRSRFGSGQRTWLPVKRQLRADGANLAYERYDRLAQVDTGAIVENKRLSHVLQVALLLQAQRDDRYKSDTPSRTNQGRPPYPRKAQPGTKRSSQLTAEDLELAVMKVCTGTTV
ncbi:hypothetical protein Pnap_4621 (plasmid) [Polaromonas naphthalenivorans CJ2]|uniref:Uncharacterized protein n=1 Tax=Polaromonas naphthalenivorans (strain CJ2) TaxID=365044 RepID=A1VWL4_POLNA|nr:hypothetical protein Pnap_4621 [Polaromonas naphthalenivorans CJ2]